MSKITLETTVVRSSDVLFSPVDNELVMMDIEQGAYFSLDRVGASIWNQLAEPLVVTDLCKQLMQQYDVDQATCETDVLALLNDMAENGLLRQL